LRPLLADGRHYAVLHWTRAEHRTLPHDRAPATNDGGLADAIDYY